MKAVGIVFDDKNVGKKTGLKTEDGNIVLLKEFRRISGTKNVQCYETNFQFVYLGHVQLIRYKE